MLSLPVREALPASQRPDSPSHPRPDATIGHGRTDSALSARSNLSGRQTPVLESRRPVRLRSAFSPEVRARACAYLRSSFHRRPRTLRDRRAVVPGGRGRGGLSRPRPLLRPCVLLDALLGIAGLVVILLASGRRTTFEIQALRSPGIPYLLDEGVLRNVIHLDV